MRFLDEPLARAVAAEHQVDPDLVVAMCLVESSGNPRAYRYEPDFYRRYMADDPRWATADPKRVSASYGLLQVMYLVALEFGLPRDAEPEALFDARTGLTYGCKVLRERIDWTNRAAADVSAETRLRAALASYNGGKGGNAADHRPDRNAKYADKVLRTLAQVRA